jgi:hypothetical protein
MAGSPAEFLLCHFEKLILTGLCLGVAAAWGFAPPDPSTRVEALDQKRRRVAHHMQVAKPGSDPLLNRPLQLEQRLSATAPAQPLPPWLMHRRPGIIPDERPWQDLNGELGQPTISAELLTRSVRVRWKAPKHSDFLVLSYRLERQLDGGEWELLKEPEEDERTYEDTTLEARSEARYRLSVTAAIDETLIARHKRQRRRLKLAKSEQSRSAGPTEALSLIQDVFIIPRTIWEPNDLAGTPGRAYVTVYVRGDDGKVRKKGFPVEVGAPIGEEVAVGRKKVDYRTHATLLEVRKEVSEQPNGRKVTTGVIKVRWPEGKTEEITTEAAPPE